MRNAALSGKLSFDRLILGECLVDPASLSLHNAAKQTTVEPKVMVLLQVLAERPLETWQRQDILDRIWPNCDGGDESLTRLVYLLRKAFNQVNVEGKLIKTVARRGYRLEHAVSRANIYDNHEITGDGTSSHPTITPTNAPHAFSVAVLPFTGTFKDPEDNILLDGMTRDLTALLSRTPRLHVAPVSSALFASETLVRVADQARTLGVRYLVSGTLSGNKKSIRFRVDLTDSETGQLVWTEKYDAVPDEYFNIQDDIVLSISTAISTKLKISTIESAVRARPFNLAAYERVQMAKNLRSNYGPQTAIDIETNLKEALSLEPENAIAMAELAVQLSQNVVSKWTDNEDLTRRQANQLIEGALSQAPNDAEVIASAGIVNTMFHQPDIAIRYLERAIALNPNSAHALAVLGWQKCLRHSDPEGIEQIRAAELRAPHHPRYGLWATYRATAHLFMLDYDKAVPACRDAIIRTPNYYQPHLTLAWALIGADTPVEAQKHIERACAFGDYNITKRFVGEMKKWSGNSPNKKACATVLNRLLPNNSNTEQRLQRPISPAH